MKRVIAIVVGASCVAGWTAGAAAPQRTVSSSRPLITALSDYGVPSSDYALFLQRARRAGATAIRTGISWANVVAGSQPTPDKQVDPSYAGYDWNVSDSRIAAIVAQGLIPIVEIQAAPSWAERSPPAGSTRAPAGGTNIDPAAYGRFAQAAATRYSGHFEGLPRVRYWDAWNEPNLSLFLGPQFVGDRPYSPDLYRAMLNAFSAAVKSVAPDNLVIAGETAPFRDLKVLKFQNDWGPLTFMRDLLCLSKTLKPTCNAVVHFDIWAHHPYTSGGPEHKAVLSDDVSLGDLPKMTTVLNAAYAAGHVQTSGGVPAFWVTEFGWDSKPPDPGGVPIGLLKRWVAGALARMWQDGVSEVTWLQLVDLPLATSNNQGGLYFVGDSFPAAKPKPILEAFRFPFTVSVRGATAAVWARTPGGAPGLVAVEQRRGSAWRRLGVLRANAAGIVQGSVKLVGPGPVRGRLLASGETSLPYGLVEPPDHFYNPFGLTTLLEPPTKK